MSSDSSLRVQSEGEGSSDDETAEVADVANSTATQDKETTNKETRPKDVCGHCKKKCTSSGQLSHAFQCDYCQFWFHASCEGYSEAEYKKLVDVTKLIPNINYYCNFSNCQQVNNDVVKSIGATATKVRQNTEAIRKLKTECEKKFKDIDSKIVTEVQKNTESLIDEKVKNAWLLERERARRARNIIILKYPEPDQTLSPTDKENKDREEVEKLFKDHMKVNESDYIIQSTMRLGRNANRNGTPRTLKVTLDREYMCRNVLRGVKNIHSATDLTIRNLNIFQDMIKEDRIARKKLVDEAKAKNEILKQQIDPATGLPVTDKWTVRGDKLVLVDKDFNVIRNF